MPSAAQSPDLITQSDTEANEDSKSENTENMATALVTNSNQHENSDASLLGVSFGDLNLSSDTLDREEFSPESSPRVFHPVVANSKTPSNESLPILPNQKNYDYLLKVMTLFKPNKLNNGVEFFPSRYCSLEILMWASKKSSLDLRTERSIRLFVQALEQLTKPPQS